MLRFILEPDSIDITDQLGFHLDKEDYQYIDKISRRDSIVNFDKNLLIEKNKEIDFMSEISQDMKSDQQEEEESIESLVVQNNQKSNQKLTNVSSFLKKSLDEKDSGGIGLALNLSPLILKPGGTKSTREKLEKEEMKKYLSMSNIHTISGTEIDEKTLTSFENLK